MTYKTFTAYTEETAHFDLRDIEDLLESRKRQNDFSPTLRVWDNQGNDWTDFSPELEWDRAEQERLRNA